MGGWVDRPLRGLGVVDTRFGLSSLAPRGDGPLDSSYSEAGPAPGVMVPPGPHARLRGEIRGGQTEDLELRVVASGNPGVVDGAAMVYCRTPGGPWLGWDAPVTMSSWVPVGWSSSAPWTSLAAVTIPSTQEVLLFAGRSSGVGGLWRWDPGSRTWGAESVPGISPGAGAVSAYVLPDERIVVMHGSGTAYSSTDRGQTWSLYAVAALGGTVGTYGGVARAAVAGDAVVHFHLEGGWLTQRASVDQGASFDLVGSGNLGWIAFDAVAAPDGGVAFAYVTAAGECWAGRVGSASESVVGSEQVHLGPTTQMVMWSDADGRLYLARHATRYWYLHVSRDGGRTWDLFADRAIRDGGLTRGSVAVAAAGSVLWAHQVSDGQHEGSVGCWEMGGWSTVTGRRHTGSRRLIDAPGLGQGQQWFPFGPSDDWTGWEAVGPSPTVTLQGAESLEAGYTVWLDEPPANADFVSVSFSVRVLSGAHWVRLYSLAAGGRGGTIQLFEGKIVLEDWFTSDQTEIAIDLTEWTEVRASLGGGGLDVYVRRPGELEWTHARRQVGIFGASGTEPVRFSQASGSSEWRYRSAIWEPAGGSPASGWGHWGEAGELGRARGKQIGGLAYPVPGVGSVTQHGMLALTAGPGVIGEEYLIPVHHEHGAQNLFVETAPSRSEDWRSLDRGEQVFAFDLGEATLPGDSPLFAVALLGINFRRAWVESVDPDTGAWQTEGIIDAAQGQPLLPVRRDGDYLVATNEDPIGGYVQAGQYVGGMAVMGYSAWRIVEHGGGGWHDGSAGGVPLEVRIEGVQPGDPESGFVRLCAPSVVCVIHRGRERRSYFRVRIPANEVGPDPYYRIGSMLPVGLRVLGQQWSDGWQHEHVPRVSSRRSEYGTLRQTEQGPVATAWTLAWPDGLKLGALRGNPRPDWLGVEGGPALASYQDVWWELRSLQRRSRGGQVPLLAVSAIPETTTTITDPTLFLAGLLTSSIQWSQSHGSEGVNEFGRIEPIRIEELV